MRVLTVPNWSFGRNRFLAQRFEEIIAESEVSNHFLEGDVDHNRTVSAFSGEWKLVRETLLTLANEAMDAIDLNRHVGVHPRIGALDVCPFIPLDDTKVNDLLPLVDELAAEIADRYSVPIFLYEKSERGRHESALPELRKGGFGGLLLRSHLDSDFGPKIAHPRLGATVLGVRDFLVAMNANIQGVEHLALAKSLAREMRRLRQEGDERFLGVRALGLPLSSADRAQVSLNITLPSITPLDPILEWIRDAVTLAGAAIAENQLIGVIREQDVVTASRLPIRPSQVVQGSA